jgi:ABC-2 type transport system ATP-binding protein
MSQFSVPASPMSQNYAVYLHQVEKRFGDKTAIYPVTLGLEAGKITGLIGCNGSGKTVLIKMICGLMRPTRGTIEVMGDPVSLNRRSRASIGAIIETPGIIPEFSGYKNLKFLAGLTHRADEQAIWHALRVSGLEQDAHKRAGKYSLGMRQRLGIAQAIMEDPEILLLDEPMNGLDRKGTDDMRQLFQALRAQGKTILLASHNALDIDMLCDSVYQVENGRVTPV